MKPCKLVQEKLVSGESLDRKQCDHLKYCEECSGFRAALDSVVSLARNHPLESTPQDISSVQNFFREHLSSTALRPAHLWWLAASATLAMAASLFLLFIPPAGPRDEAGLDENIFSLMDEISAITQTAEDEVDQTENDAVVQVTDLFDDSNIGNSTEDQAQDTTTAGSDLVLPQPYRFLEEALETDWF